MFEVAIYDGGEVVQCWVRPLQTDVLRFLRLAGHVEVHCEDGGDQSEALSESGVGHP